MHQYCILHFSQLVVQVYARAYPDPFASSSSVHAPSLGLFSVCRICLAAADSPTL
ncbi:hypothetical protein BDV97DRAFT_362363 [Delphinella strobiligena]|nr:hypothetical protein BDV97DRAFT_362363 [Delphinella strobiligena]